MIKIVNPKDPVRMKMILSRLALLPALILLLQTSLNAQADYSFKDAVLVSGTGLQTGAKYKFSNVKSDVDAFVTVKTQTGGISLTGIDNNTTGFDEAFQPSVNIQNNSAGYIEFQIDFVVAGTGTAKVQNNVPVTSIDVDGTAFTDGVLHMQDQVQFFPGYYDFAITGSKLEVTIPGGWVVIKNTSGYRNSRIDTASKELMATVVNKDISSFLLRIGGINSSTTISEERIRSIYFKPFTYGHMTTLPNRTMLSFSGTKKQNFVELKGLLSASHSYDKMFIERAVSPNVFGSLIKMDISGSGTAEFNFTYLDTNPENGINYYRIRLVNTVSNIQEISNTLMVKMDNNKKNLEIVNTVLQAGNPLITINSPEDSEADLQVFDFSGRLINITKTKLNSGINNINLPGFNTDKSNFVLIVRTKNNTISRKIMIQ